jgi:hypothetical protein
MKSGKTVLITFRKEPLFNLTKPHYALSGKLRHACQENNQCSVVMAALSHSPMLQ